MTGAYADGAGEAARHLAALAEKLAGRGFAAHVTQADGYAAVSIANLSVPQLAETVYAAPADGAWWFWWSWADRIAQVSDVEAASFKIAYVLTPHASL